jgi:hypothetical protein
MGVVVGAVWAECGRGSAVPPGAVNLRDGTSTGRSPAVSYSLPPPEPQHTWSDLLTLVGAIRRIAYNPTMAPDDEMRRIRDLFLDYDHPEAAGDA